MASGSKSFYGRKLPEGLVDYRSNESKARLLRCISNGTAVPFLSLSSCFNSQAEPAYCGLSTLAIILNALRIDPQRLWKTPWRWFTEELLDCCRPLEVVKKVGITMEQFLCLAKCNGAQCEMLRPEDNEKDYEFFRRALYCVCTGGKELKERSDTAIEEQVARIEVEEENPKEFIAISYSRKCLKQTGSGHFSPIAAFDLDTDSALVLDTARFKYPPYWVPVQLLFQSMLPIDQDTGKSRGFFLLTAKSEFQSRRVCSVWKELLATEQDETLSEPHPVFDTSLTCCRETCASKLTKGLVKNKENMN